MSYRLRGRHAVKPETRAAVARCVLFLKSGLLYEWPSLRPALGSLLVGLLTAGYTVRRARREWEATGTCAVWPFFRVSDYEAALRQPPFLTGCQVG